MRSRFALLALIAFLVTGLSGAAGAQAWPSQTVKLIIPTSPGGPTDVLARLMQPRLQQMWGQNVLIENRPGGALMIGANVVAKSPPDGYTLLISNDGPLTINPHLYNKMAYDPRTELVAVTNIVDAPMIMVVNPSVPAKTVGEFIALAKANPGKFNFANGGSTSRLAMERFKLMTKTDLVAVPFAGSGQSTQALVGNVVQVMIDGLASSLPLAQSGQLRGLGVGSPKRLPNIDIPAIAETVPGYIGSTWLGMTAPAGTPIEIRRKIQQDIAKVMEDPEVRDRVAKLAMYPLVNTPEEFAKFLEEDSAQWAAVIREAKIPKVD